MAKADLPELLTDAEAAERLRISARTLREMRARGEIEYVLVGRKRFYTLAQLAEFIATNSVREERVQPRRNVSIPRPAQGVTKFSERHRGGSAKKAAMAHLNGIIDKAKVERQRELAKRRK